jgi:hypothetical protein
MGLMAGMAACFGLAPKKSSEPKWPSYVVGFLTKKELIEHGVPKGLHIVRYNYGRQAYELANGA